MVRLIVWFLAGAVVAGAVASMLGTGPERIRALLLFPVGFGLLVGSGLAVSAREFGVGPRWVVTMLSCVVVASGLVIVARAAYGELVDLARSRVNEDSRQLFGLQVLEQQAAADPTQLKSYLQQRMALDPRFEDYLMGRVSALGIWRSPWPAVIWIVEVLLATGAAGWLVWRIVSRPMSVVGPSESGTSDDGLLTTDNGERT